MFMLITPVSGNLITHEAVETLSVYCGVKDGLLVVVDGKPFHYDLDAVQSWQGYPSREAALVDGADMRAYPGWG
jgi:hypothetical protein